MFLDQLGQCFLINRFDPIDLLSAAHHFTLPISSSIQTVKVCIKWSKVDIPSHVLQRLMRLKQWFERFVNQWCLINVQEMHFAHWSIIWAKFRPLNCILKLRFQILTPPGIKLSCWLWFSSLCRYIHFQKIWHLSAVRHKIKLANYYFGSEKTDIDYTCNVSFSVQYIK